MFKEVQVMVDGFPKGQENILVKEEGFLSMLL